MIQYVLCAVLYVTMAPPRKSNYIQFNLDDYI